jgi:ketosteroid isomerase-like protein
MERRGFDTSVSPTERTIPNDPERTIATPRFDEKSVQRAQPAVPLNARGKARVWPPAFVVACVVAGVLGVVLGVAALTLIQRNHTRSEAAAPALQTKGGAASGASDASSAPAANVPPPQEEKTAARNGPDRAADAPQPTAQATTEAGGVDAGASAPNEDTQAELRGALEEWVAATNARDVSRQMKFYAPTVEAFYLSRNATREAVRAEKSRVFASAGSVNVHASAPDIRLSRDGRMAVMRFRKRYRIGGGDGSRSGEVLQELRWRRTPGGWKIVSERDMRVIQ